MTLLKRFESYLRHWDHALLKGTNIILINSRFRCLLWKRHYVTFLPRTVSIFVSFSSEEHSKAPSDVSEAVNLPMNSGIAGPAAAQGWCATTSAAFRKQRSASNTHQERNLIFSLQKAFPQKISKSRMDSGMQKNNLSIIWLKKQTYASLRI